MIAPNFNRPGGLMDVTFLGNGKVRIVQRMPNPASTNLPFITIDDSEMSEVNYRTYIEPAIQTMGGKLVKTVDAV